MVQMNLIVYGWLRANDAAQAGVRVAVVTDTVSTDDGSNAQSIAQKAILYVLGIGLPAKTTVWKKPLGSLEDRGGSNIYMYSAHAYYLQKVMFASLLQPIMGDNDPFIKSGGMVGSFYGGGIGALEVSKKYGVTGAAHCRMIKSPDWEFYNRSWKDGPEF